MADASSKKGTADARWGAVEHGSDSDRTGSIAGNLLVAVFRVEKLPPRWLKQVELSDATERLADDLYAASALRTELDFESYPPT